MQSHELGMHVQVTSSIYFVARLIRLSLPGSEGRPWRKLDLFSTLQVHAIRYHFLFFRVYVNDGFQREAAQHVVESGAEELCGGTRFVWSSD